jgi:DNA polymerase-4
VGERTARRLQDLGVSTIGQLQEVPLERLVSEFGKFGRTLYDLARGIDTSPVVPEREARSIGHERTFAEDFTDRAVLKKTLFALSEEVGRRLRAERLKGKTVQLKVRFADFTTITRAATLARPTNLTEHIWEEVERLFDERVQLRQGVRLLGVRVSGLAPEGQEELPLFPDEGRSAELERLIDELRKRFGEDAIRWGRSL